MTDIAHLVLGGAEVGQEVTGLCGATYVCTGLKGLNVCAECVDVELEDMRLAREVIKDLGDRLGEICVALAMTDELGQRNWLHIKSEEAILDALYRPGAGRREGPHMEDGSFDHNNL